MFHKQLYIPRSKRRNIKGILIVFTFQKGRKREKKGGDYKRQYLLNLSKMCNYRYSYTIRFLRPLELIWRLYLVLSISFKFRKPALMCLFHGAGPQNNDFTILNSLFTQVVFSRILILTFLLKSSQEKNKFYLSCKFQPQDLFETSIYNSYHFYKYII